MPHFLGSNTTPVEKRVCPEQKVSLTQCDQDAVEAPHVPQGHESRRGFPQLLRGPVTPAPRRRFITISVNPRVSNKMQREAYPKWPS